jgi:hypothetical protein
MIWLTWRQFRLPVATMFVIVAVGGAVLLVAAGLDITGQGEAYLRQLSDSAGTAYLVSIGAVYVLPGAIGVFWGAPLVARELENGTHRLVWNQTVTRTRWLVVKIGIGGLAAMAVAGLTSLVVGWWAAPIDAAAETTNAGLFVPRISGWVFAARGIAPMGHAVFAFVLGVAVGAVLRRTVAAMAVTLVLFAAVQVLFPLFVRPHVMPPVEQTTPMSQVAEPMLYVDDAGHIIRIRAQGPPGVWMVANNTVDAAGDVVSVLPAEVSDCAPTYTGGSSAQAPRPLSECMAKLDALGYKQRLTFQPSSRFWPLQAVELGIFLALSGLLAWFSVRWISRPT